MNKSAYLFIKSLVLLVLPVCLFTNPNILLFAESGENLVPIKHGVSAPCLNDLFNTSTGTVKAHVINIDFTGRIAIGDLNGDGSVDYVISNRNRIAAYDVCGVKLWDKPASTNWDIDDVTSPGTKNHPYWNWTSYGYIGDADGDGAAEFLYIGSDWKTLHIINGLDGSHKYSYDLGAGPWFYVLLGRRSGEAFEKTTRIFVTGRPSESKIKSLDIRNGSPVMEPNFEWFYSTTSEDRYMPPIVANLDGIGGDEIIHSGNAVSESGTRFWRHTFTDSVGNGAHTLTVKDIDPNREGLEAVYSLYGYDAKKEGPSIAMIAASDPDKRSWENPQKKPAHQHTVGDFLTGSPGLETIARNGDGKNHWLINYKGVTVDRNIRLDQQYYPSNWGFNLNSGFAGELVQGIEWDEKPGTEVLYTERHVGFKTIPMLMVTSLNPTRQLTPAFHGGTNPSIIPRVDPDPNLFANETNKKTSWYGYYNRGGGNPNRYSNDGPYEGGAHAVDLIGDGREEVLTYSAQKIIIYYNSGDAGIPKRWGLPNYMKTKKIWTQVYNPR